ncbi:MAG: hypothetical protein ACJA0F_001232 [Dinoroseobacter sp.]|jgi:hypothetical protein
MWNGGPVSFDAVQLASGSLLVRWRLLQRGQFVFDI